MSKLSNITLCSRMTTKCLLVFCGFIVIIAVYFPARHARHYDFIQPNEVLNEILLHDFSTDEHNLKNCTYKNVIQKNTEIEIDEIYKNLNDYEKPDAGNVFLLIYTSSFHFIFSRRQICSKKLLCTNQSSHNSSLQK